MSPVDDEFLFVEGHQFSSIKTVSPSE